MCSRVVGLLDMLACIEVHLDGRSDDELATLRAAP
jgi:hypothetical protein